MVDNRYEPPRETSISVSPANSDNARDLLKASNYLTRMGLCSMLYFFPAGLAALYAGIFGHDMSLTVRLVMLAIPLALVSCDITLTLH